MLPGCRPATPSAPAPAAPPALESSAANALFLKQKTFDPWVLTSTDRHNTLPAYFADGKTGSLVAANGNFLPGYAAGGYDQSGQLAALPRVPVQQTVPPEAGYRQVLSLKTGVLTTTATQAGTLHSLTQESGVKILWPRLWQTSDIVIEGDPEAQQVTHANLFYLLSSTYPGSNHSIPPFGLSSNGYGGHIFWDAEVWMMPALVVQHPEYARSIIAYRFRTLGQAKKNAKTHGFKGAEYAWESADTGAEMAPAEFAQERHITADVGWAAWQYYLWTGDKAYLETQGWAVLSATAQYWVSRVTKSTDGKYHVKTVLSPDETAGVVDDDAYTNAVVQADLRAAARAARAVGQPADPRWTAIAAGMVFAQDKTRGIPAENAKPMTDRFSAKQADALLLLHPLNVPIDAPTAGRMLDFYAAHTSKFGPAMTASIQAVAAARLGRGKDALDQFHESYRPFMRGPWAAFAEKRTSSRVYFCTGMGGCLQSVLYGFAGLRVVEPNEKASGTKLAGDAEAALYADPHLPPGWSGLTIKGVRFRGKMLDVAVTAGDKVTATPR